MKRLAITALAAFAALGWAEAVRQREKGQWASPADVEQLLADVVSSCVEEPDPGEGADYGSFAAVNVVRAKEPPHAAHPWYAVAATTTFHVDEETGLRVIESGSGWYATKDAAMDAAVTLAMPAPIAFEPPDF